MTRSRRHCRRDTGAAAAAQLPLPPPLTPEWSAAGRRAKLYSDCLSFETMYCCSASDSATAATAAFVAAAAAAAAVATTLPPPLHKLLSLVSPQTIVPARCGGMWILCNFMCKK